MALSFRGKIKNGRSKLVVYGNASTGYKLGAMDGNKTVTTFGAVFPKQRDAVAYGEAKFAKVASPVYPKSDEPKPPAKKGGSSKKKAA
jgi:hypothetical protein